LTIQLTDNAQLYHTATVIVW